MKKINKFGVITRPSTYIGCNNITTFFFLNPSLIVYLSIYSKLLNLLILLCSHIARITILRQNSQNLSLSQVTSLQSEDGKTAVGQQPLGLGDGGGRVDLLVVRQTSSCELCTEILHHQIINSLVVNLKTGLTLLSSTRPATPEIME